MFQRICISLKTFFKGKGKKEGGRDGAGQRAEGGREREAHRVIYRKREGDMNSHAEAGRAERSGSLLRELQAVALRSTAMDLQLFQQAPALRSQPCRNTKSHSVQGSKD